MIPFLVGLVVGVPAKPVWDLAICARFYYPVGDRRVSRRGYYLMTLDGRRKRRVGPLLGSRDVAFFDWRDRGHVVWLENGHDTFSIVQMDVSTGRSRVLWRWAKPKHGAEDFDFPADVQKALGSVLDEPAQGPAKLLGVKSAPYVSLRGQKYPVRNANLQWKATYGAEGLDWVSLPAYLDDGYDLTDYGQVGRWRFLGFQDGLTAHEGITYLLKVDAQRRISWVIPANVVSISARVKRDLWAGRSERDLGSYADTDVWTTSVSVGRISEGKPKVILQGRVFVYDVSLRP